MSIQFGHVYRLPDGTCSSAVKMFQAAFQVHGFPSKAVRGSSSSQGETYVVTGDQYQVLTGLENEMAQRVKTLGRSSHDRSTMASLVSQYNEFVANMCNPLNQDAFEVCKVPANACKGGKDLKVSSISRNLANPELTAVFGTNLDGLV